MTVPVFVTTVRGASRSAALDALRGLAIVCMIVDHVMVVTGGSDLIRNTVGRIAAPLFFLVSGHLVRRLSWRHVAIAVAGLLLPLWVVWIDRPNVLVVYALGAALLVLFRRFGVPPWLLVVVALAFSANGWRLASPQSFDVLALLGVMAVGAVLPRSTFAPADRLPRSAAAVGRHPLAWYLGHVLVLDLLLRFGGSSSAPIG